MADVAQGSAANFSDEHIGRAAFDQTVRASDNWLRVGESLLRGARAIMRQVYLDYSRRADPDVRERLPDSRAELVNQAIFLAALATEDGLKAVIAEGLPSTLPKPPSGVLPDALGRNGHDLVDLASRAAIAPADDQEREALKRGQNYIEWLGRYPSTAVHNEHHTRAAIDVSALFAAYERLFFTCVEETECRKCRRLGRSETDAANEARKDRLLREWMASGVDDLPLGCVVPRIEIATYPGYVTWATWG